MAGIQHPVLASIHPWMFWIAIVLSVFLVGKFVIEHLNRRYTLHSLWFIVIVVAAWCGWLASDPRLEGDNHWDAVALFVMMCLAAVALPELFLQWERKIFQYLVFAPIGVMVIKRTMEMAPSLKDIGTHLVAVVATIPPSYLTLITAATALLALAAACIELIKAILK